MDNRYAIVVNSGRGRYRAWKILDRATLKLSAETYEYKPVEECKKLNAAADNSISRKPEWTAEEILKREG
jgi:hypothetical protein